jgi:hypothetical protein
VQIAVTSRSAPDRQPRLQPQPYRSSPLLMDRFPPSEQKTIVSPGLVSLSGGHHRGVKRRIAMMLG